MRMAEIGATPAGGVHRLALTGEDIEAHRLLSDWAVQRKFSVELDAIGNIFIARAGSNASLPPVASGSHTDTQPKGGRFDGIFGVLAAFEALKAALPDAGARELGAPLCAFIEAHIEQGPELEANGITIGAVTGMQGCRRFTVTVTGESAHSGTTPRARRRDAFVAAMNMAQELRNTMLDDDDIVRFTIGRFAIPGSGISVEPGQVEFTIDLRHPDAATLRELGDRIPEICNENAGPCKVAADEFINQDPLDFPESIISAIEAAAARRGISHQRIYSAAGHDARHVAKLCTAGMICIPCWRGLSHNETERAEPEHIAAAS